MVCIFFSFHRLETKYIGYKKKWRASSPSTDLVDEFCAIYKKLNFLNSISFCAFSLQFFFECAVEFATISFLQEMGTVKTNLHIWKRDRKNKWCQFFVGNNLLNKCQEMVWNSVQSISLILSPKWTQHYLTKDSE